MTTPNSSRIVKSWKQKIGKKEHHFFSDGMRTFHLIEGGNPKAQASSVATYGDKPKKREEETTNPLNEMECFLLQTHFDYGSRAWSAPFLAEQFNMSLKELAIALIPLIASGHVSAYMTTYRMTDKWFKEIEAMK